MSLEWSTTEVDACASVLFPLFKIFRDSSDKTQFKNVEQVLLSISISMIQFHGLTLIIIIFKPIHKHSKS
jgi:hypothetical protein